MPIREKAGSIALMLLLLIIILRMASPVVNVAIDETRSNYEDTVVIAGGSGQLEQFIALKDLTVQQSLDNTVRFTGASDSQLTGSADIPHDDTWTVSTWARLNGSVNQATAQMRVLRLGGFLYLSYNQTQWRAVYYDDITLNSYAVSINAPSPTNWTHLSIQSNSTHLAIHRNNTSQNAVALTDGNTFTGSYITNNLHGTVEDTRVLDDNATGSQRGTLYNTPTAPVKANETARIYYDRYPGESTVDVFRTGSDLSASNASTVDGFTGQGASHGSDWTRSGGTLSAAPGGSLDGAPAAFAQYSAVGVFGAIIGDVINLGGAALGLLVVGALIIAYSALQPYFTEF